MTMSRFETKEVSQIKYQTDDEKLELFGMLKENIWRLSCPTGKHCRRSGTRTCATH